MSDTPTTTPAVIPPAKPEPEKLAELTFSSLESLQSCLTTAGWSSKPSDQICAGFLAERIDGMLAGKPAYTGDVNDAIAAAAFSKELKAWQRGKPDEPLAVSQKEWRVSVAAVSHFAGEKKLPAHYGAAVLMRTLKLDSD